VSVKAARCRFCGRTVGVLVEDPSLGARRSRRTAAGRVLDVRQTWHHVACLVAASGADEMPYPGQGELETARQRRKETACQT